MATFEERRNSAGEKRIRVTIRRAGFKTQRATFATMKKAREWAAKEETAMRDGRYGLADAADAHTAGEMIGKYIETILPRKSHKKRYLANQAAQLNWWKERLGGTKLSHVTPALMSACRDELLKDHTPATANRYRAALSHVFTVAIREWQWLAASPLLTVTKPKEAAGRLRYLSDEERAALLAACGREKRKPLQLIVLLAISTGARKMEILSMKWRDMDFARGLVTIHDTKNSESRPLFLSNTTLPALQSRKMFCCHPKSEFVFPARCGTRPVSIDREFRRALKRAGIEGFRFHDLRHTAASYMAMNGATPAEIAEVLGHKSLNLVQRYAHLSKTHTAGVVASMNEKIFGGGSL